MTQSCTVYFKTLGCKVNQYETQRMRERLSAYGCTEVDTPDHARYIIINSCTVTKESDRKTLYFVRRFKRQNPSCILVLAGCITEGEKESPLPDEIDIILSNEEKEHIVEKLFPGAVTHTCEPSSVGITSFEGHTRAFIKIQDGCPMQCSYCKVRLVRGKSRSRALPDIIHEAEALVAHGYKEIVLTGVHIGAYGKDCTPRIDLVSVIEALARVVGIMRIRISSIEPMHITPRFIACMESLPVVCPHLHVPLQSGSDVVLQRMRRGYTAQSYVDTIAAVRSRIPDFSLTTDIIVGFPGEDDKAFHETVRIIHTVEPFKIHVFPFSKRKGTEAYSFTDTVSPVCIAQREEELLRLNDQLFMSTSRTLVGRIFPVLIERTIRHKGYTEGHLPDYRRVEMHGEDSHEGDIVSVRITDVKESHLVGEKVSSSN